MPRLTSYTLRKRRGRPLPVVIAMSLLLVAGLTLGALRLGWLPGVIAWANARAATPQALYTPQPTPTTGTPELPMATGTPAPMVATTEALTATAATFTNPSTLEPAETLISETTPTELPSPPTATAEPEEMLTPAPDPAAAQDHYWLERPIGPGGQVYANAFYPYGSNGRGQYLPHYGVDIVNKLGTPVLAVAEAEVVAAGPDTEQVVGPSPNFYGNFIALRLFRTYQGQPVFVLYGHLSQVDVRAGETVQPGQPIGRVGMSGVAIGPHLHIEVRIGQNDYAHTRNPELWLKPTPGYGTIVGRLIDAQGRPLANVSILVYQSPRFDRIWQQIYTYLDEPGINSDDEWGENFMLADVPVGVYRLETKVSGRIYQQEIEIKDGQTTFALIQTTD